MTVSTFLFSGLSNDTQDWTNPSNALVDDGSYTTSSSDGNTFTLIGLKETINDIVTGLQLEIEAKEDATGNDASLFVSLSMDSGNLWSHKRETSEPGTSDTILNIPTDGYDDWGLDLNDINENDIKVRVESQFGGSQSLLVSVDVVKLNVEHGEPHTPYNTVIGNTTSWTFNSGNINDDNSKLSNIRHVSSVSLRPDPEYPDSTSYSMDEKYLYQSYTPTKNIEISSISIKFDITYSGLPPPSSQAAIFEWFNGPTILLASSQNVILPEGEFWTKFPLFKPVKVYSGQTYGLISWTSDTANITNSCKSKNSGQSYYYGPIDYEKYGWVNVNPWSIDITEHYQMKMTASGQTFERDVGWEFGNIEKGNYYISGDTTNWEWYLWDGENVSI
jgi:hypothetical protein